MLSEQALQKMRVDVGRKIVPSSHDVVSLLNEVDRLRREERCAVEEIARLNGELTDYMVKSSKRRNRDEYLLEAFSAWSEGGLS